MYKTRMGEAVDHGVKLQLGYVETDPSGRYGRFRDILGKGAMKTVYKAFDEVLGMEVAWNQVKLIDVFRSPEELQRLYSEVHLLKNLSHDSIMRFHAYWVDVDRRTFNFITELFTSGTLREYRQRYKRVSMRAIKNWARQILEGLAYLHSHDPPVIHRDLKCDNIFVNGHLGQVKIGDLGLAAILGGSHHAHSVIGTPEFMAPELYEEEYDELVDVYSFGMCVMEMLTSEYPYSECSNPAQIYKKVTSGKLPEAFYRIQDLEAQRFIGKCLETASKRPSAHELLLDPFLASEEDVPLMPIHKIPSRKLFPESRVLEMPPPFADPERSTDMTITGSMNAEDDTIFLKVQITDKQGQARNIFFPFDIASDTAMDVALEMVKELDITDWKPHEIAEMIDEEIKFLVPNWKTLDDSPRNLQQHSSFNYEDDDDDDNTHHPFYSFSSHSSSEASLTGLLAPCESQCYGRNIAMTTGYEWLQEDIKSFDDASSESSLNSYKYSNLNYCSAYDEQDYETSSKTKDPHYMARTSKCSRFSPQVSIADKRDKDNSALHKSGSACGLNHHHKMTRTRSLMDIRSQLLHRTIVEEINRRRMFKTVAAVENIGYHEPGDFPREGSSSDRFKRIF